MRQTVGALVTVVVPPAAEGGREMADTRDAGSSGLPGGQGMIRSPARPRQGERILVARESRPKLLGLLAVDIALIAGCGAAFLGGPLGVLMGLAGMAFFALGGWVVLRRLFARGPALVIDAEGILDLRASPRMMRWSEITDVRLQVVQGTPVLSLWLRDPDTYWRSMVWYRRPFARMGPRTGCGHTGISAIGTQRSFQEVCEYVCGVLANRSRDAAAGRPTESGPPESPARSDSAE
jgi:hypothetical protein